MTDFSPFLFGEGEGFSFNSELKSYDSYLGGSQPSGSLVFYPLVFSGGISVFIPRNVKNV